MWILTTVDYPHQTYGIPLNINSLEDNKYLEITWARGGTSDEYMTASYHLYYEGEDAEFYIEIDGATVNELKEVKEQMIQYIDNIHCRCSGTIVLCAYYREKDEGWDSFWQGIKKDLEKDFAIDSTIWLMGTESMQLEIKPDFEKCLYVCKHKSMLQRQTR